MLGLLVGLDATDSTLEDLQCEESGSASPGSPGESGEAGISTGGSADGASAEQELAEENCEGNEACEVEEDVHYLEDEVGVWVRRWVLSVC